MSGETMEEQQWYEVHCKSEFAALKTLVDTQSRNTTEILNLIKGKNGDPGLFERIRDLEASTRRLSRTATLHQATLHGKEEDSKDQGIVGQVESHHRVIKYIAGAVVFVLSTIFVRSIDWLIGKFGA